MPNCWCVSRARSQLRLQHVVEGLFVAAISYYCFPGDCIPLSIRNWQKDDCRGRLAGHAHDPA
ncbi:DUF3422 family protein [Paraburkholderia sp. 22099]|uniref:DUF3422 family protein n=1 Tax=Paraburkholderia sp. 22099 TaxID=3453875 RepID=UPI003F83260B